MTSSQALAEWLSKTFAKPEVMSPEAFDTKKANLQGVFYKVPFEGGQSMGHIDLISNGIPGSTLASGAAVWYWPVK